MVIPTAEEAVPDSNDIQVFGDDKNIDRRTRKRETPMQVLNLSFPRTGTMSVQTALEILGIKCYHSTAFFTNIADCQMWDAAMNAKFFGQGPEFTRREWDQLLGDYGGVSADPPAMVFADDLVSIYPEAKVILVERDIDSWYHSFMTNVIPNTFSKTLNFIADLDPKWMGAMRDTHQLWAKGYFHATSVDEMKVTAKQRYREHYALVRRITSKDRLLEFKLSDGWGPLCEFLDKPVPDVPFPRVNDSAALSRMINESARRACVRVVERYARYEICIVVMVILGIAIALFWR